MNGAFAEQVRQCAYEMWMADGCADGRAHDHWVAAERKLMAEASAPAKRGTAPKRAAKAAAPRPAAVKSAAPTPAAVPRAKNAAKRSVRISPEADGAPA